MSGEDYIFENGEPIAIGSPIENQFTHASGELIADGEDSLFTFIEGRGIGSAGLVSYWPMDECSGVLVEDVQSGFDGEFRGSPEWTTDAISGCAVKVDNSSSSNDHYIETPYTTNNETTNSLVVWMKISHFDHDQFNGTFSAELDERDGRLYIGPSNGGGVQAGLGTEFSSFSDYDPPLNEWFMLTVTGDHEPGETGEADVYLNDTRIGGFEYTFDVDDHTDIWFGAINDEFVNDPRPVDGIVDEGRVYARYLPHEEVTEIYESYL